MKITTIEAWCAEEENGVEGIAGAKIGNEWFPLIGSNGANKEKLESMAREIMHMTGKKMTLKRFELKEDLKTMEISKKF